MCEKVWHWNVTSFDLLILVYVWNFNSWEKIVLKSRSVFFQHSICTQMTALTLCLVCNAQDTAAWCKWNQVPTCLSSDLTSLFVYVKSAAYQHYQTQADMWPCFSVWGSRTNVWWGLYLAWYQEKHSLSYEEGNREQEGLWGHGNMLVYIQYVSFISDHKILGGTQDHFWTT